jgi:ribosomal protein S18 acetylase RimI-like enzyme
LITTRPAREQDEESVLALLGQLFERDVSGEPARGAAFRRMLGSERGFVIVAEDAGAVLGLISVSVNLAIRFDVAYAQIEELVVDSAARGRQAGAVLVRAALDEARRRGCDEMGLYPREETRAFYEKLGFAYVGVELRQRLKRLD